MPIRHALSQIWRNPAPFPWPQDWQIDPECWNSATGTPDEKYATVWKHLERQAADAVPFPVSRSACGRATTKTTKPKVFGRVAPVRKGRIVGISSLSIFVPHSAIICGSGKSDDCSHVPGMLNSMHQFYDPWSPCLEGSVACQGL